VSGDVLEALCYYRRLALHDEGELGFHVCEICGLAEDRAEFWVEWGGIRYVLPALVLHYCEAHEYLPPDEFLVALSSRWIADGASRAG
jgi:hypothetical protein